MSLSLLRCLEYWRPRRLLMRNQRSPDWHETPNPTDRDRNPSSIPRSRLASPSHRPLERREEVSIRTKYGGSPSHATTHTATSVRGRDACGESWKGIKSSSNKASPRRRLPFHPILSSHPIAIHPPSLAWPPILFDQSRSAQMASYSTWQKENVDRSCAAACFTFSGHGLRGYRISTPSSHILASPHPSGTQYQGPVKPPNDCDRGVGRDEKCWNSPDTDQGKTRP